MVQWLWWLQPDTLGLSPTAASFSLVSFLSEQVVYHTVIYHQYTCSYIILYYRGCINNYIYICTYVHMYLKVSFFKLLIITNISSIAESPSDDRDPTAAIAGSFIGVVIGVVTIFLVFGACTVIFCKINRWKTNRRRYDFRQELSVC